MEFIPKVQSFLIKKNINHKIYVVEQSAGGLFNRGKLLNIGYSLAVDCNYLALHDVDTIPVNTNIDYSFPLTPRHLFGGMHTFGGVGLISREHFNQTNGFSNLYEGWGREDVDFLHRLSICSIAVDKSNLTELEYPVDKPTLLNGWLLLPHIPTYLTENFSEEEIKDITVSAELSDKVKQKFRESQNVKRYNEFLQNSNIQWEDGLSSLNYSVIEKKNVLHYDHYVVE